MWFAGMRTATVPWVSPRSHDSDGCAGSTIVRPPGQNASTSRSTGSGTSATRARRVAMPGDEHRRRRLAAAALGLEQSLHGPRARRRRRRRRTRCRSAGRRARRGRWPDAPGACRREAAPRRGSRRWGTCPAQSIRRAAPIPFGALPQTAAREARSGPDRGRGAVAHRQVGVRRGGAPAVGGEQVARIAAPCHSPCSITIMPPGCARREPDAD